MWETFGPLQKGSNVKRPFDDAALDGFDFDFESAVTHMAPFANELRSLMNKETEKQYFLTAADRKSTRLNSSHSGESRMPSSA